MANATTEKERAKSKSYTRPPSPTHSFSSSSSSDFEFTISISPRKSSTALCPADELFYKGQLLPLHPSSRISMVQTLLSSASSGVADGGAARDSSGSSNDSQHSFFASTESTDCDSSRPSSVTEDDELKRFHNPLLYSQTTRFQCNREINKTNKYLFTFSRFSSVFRKEPSKTRDPDRVSGSSVKRASATAREVIRKYLKKVKPLYDMLSQKQQQQQQRTEIAAKTTSFLSLLAKTERSATKETERKQTGAVMLSHSFSGNLRYPRRRRSYVSSCPSSMRSSPSHSGVLSRSGFAGGMHCGRDNSSTIEELQSAIQGAIAHCKNSWIQDKSMVSDEI